jgi:cytidine deaminase
MSQLALYHHELIEAVRAILRWRFKQGYHEVGAALRTKRGRVFSAVHLEAYVGRIAICAEGIAIGMAAAAGDADVEAIVAVDRHGHVASPCGNGIVTPNVLPGPRLRETASTCSPRS